MHISFSFGVSLTICPNNGKETNNRSDSCIVNETIMGLDMYLQSFLLTHQINGDVNDTHLSALWFHGCISLNSE